MKCSWILFRWNDGTTAWSGNDATTTGSVYHATTAAVGSYAATVSMIYDSPQFPFYNICVNCQSRDLIAEE